MAVLPIGSPFLPHAVQTNHNYPFILNFHLANAYNIHYTKKGIFNVIYFFDGITLLDGGLVPSFSFQYQAHSGNPLRSLFPYAGTLDSGNDFYTGLPDMVLRR